MEWSDPTPADKIADGLDALIEEARRLRKQLDTEPATDDEDGDDPPAVDAERSS